MDILHRVTVAVAVSQSAVDKGSGPGPGKGDKAVIGVPGVDHSVKFGTGRFHLEMGELFVPVLNQFFPLPAAGCLRRPVCRQNGRALLVGFFPQQEGDGFRLARLQRDNSGKCAAAVLVVVQLAAQIAALHTDGIAIAPVGPEEFCPVAAAGCHRRTGQPEKALGHVFMVHAVAVVQRVQISVELLADASSVEQRPGDEPGVLQVDLILLVIAVAGELGVSRQRQLPPLGGIVANC